MVQEMDSTQAVSGSLPVSEPLTYHKDMREIRDRVRRIETRLVGYLEAKGMDMDTTKVIFADGVLLIPSLDVPLRKIIAAVPAQQRGRYHSVWHKGDHIGSVFIEVHD